MESIKLSGDRIAIEEALFIAKEVCKGLYHAHRRKTPDGQPLNIVHRDISPPNLLISREGEIKVVDFGLAKAATQALTTDQGMVKGKFSYLSPEAAWGQTVDERADIFAVGALIWEMLAGRRLFEGESNKETVLMVREAVVPSLEQFNPNVDDELMNIIYRSLAREPNNRYSTTKELGQDLTNYLFKHQLNVTSYDIATLVEKTLSEKEKDRRLEPEWLDDIGQVEEQLVQFTSLEDLHRMSFRSVSEESGLHNPSLLKGEDPRGWVDELGLNFTPPPTGINGNAQLDMSMGESSAKGAFSLTHPEIAAVQEHSPSSISEEQSPQRGIKSARQNQAYADEVEGDGQKMRWWIYPLVAMILMVLGLAVGAYISKNRIQQVHVYTPPPSTAIEADPKGSETLESEETSSDLDDAKDETPSSEDNDVVIEEEINFE